MGKREKIIFNKCGILATLTIIAMGISTVAAQNPEVSKGVELVKQAKIREFEKEVKDVIFAKDKKTDNIYPRVVIGEESIEFLDEKGNVKKEKKIKKMKGRGFITKSRNGKAFGAWEALEINEDKSYVTDSRFTLLNENGEVVWEKTGWQGEGGPSLEISDDGETVVVYDFVFGGSAGGCLAFYNSKGLIKEITPLEGKSFGNGYVSFSEDGNFCAVAIGNPHQWLILYDKLGNELWRRVLGGDGVGQVTISPMDNLILVTYYPHKKDNNKIIEFRVATICYDINGNKKWELNGWGIPMRQGEGLISFSGDSKYIVLSSVVYPDDKIALVEVIFGKVVWEKNYRHDKSIERKIFLNSIEISAKGEFAVIGLGLAKEYNPIKKVREDMNKPRKIFIVNKQGEDIKELELKSDPSIEIIEGKVIVRTSNRMYEYEVQLGNQK